ncbi:Hpt domain-containing protein [Actinospica sp. MGRD01-02]|uniref:Hpt domain-containing protein n=1 Tax=Actinospica acidithermotolerans TaxID=2828514 RepID=A0A941EI86_9ACTN|nr:Hpt domain-containing protein [Actinospica acidithermotolerans]MBR7831190.1 Hpt domain-containing protein [Actinospica acidithermotolerans]
MTGPARRPRPHPDPEVGAVSRAQLARVREDVGELSLRNYVSAYLDLLPGRLERIDQAVAAADGAEATRVMFDLRAASAMLGARRLPALLSALETTLNVGLPASPAQLAVVRAEADAVAAALRRYLGSTLGPTSAD